MSALSKNGTQNGSTGLFLLRDIVSSERPAIGDEAGTARRAHRSETCVLRVVSRGVHEIMENVD